MTESDVMSVEDNKLTEIIGDLWDQEADIICITTNGFVKNNGQAVMGKGCAKEAVERIGGIKSMLGTLIKKHGNCVSPIINMDYIDDEGNSHSRVLCSFPVKNNWWEDADLNIIARSARQLLVVVDAYQLENVVVPRPGCGAGNLKWEDVRPVLEEVWGGDSRIKVIDFG